MTNKEIVDKSILRAREIVNLCKEEQREMYEDELDEMDNLFITILDNYVI